jgi:hypothetical protein
MTNTPDPDRLARIPARWAVPDPAIVSKMPKAGIQLDYVGHADITLALIDIDPTWTWEPAAIDPATGGPVITTMGNRLVMWGYLTICGVRRMAVGTCEARKGDPEKELIGDLLRNGAMRFGVATTLWSKAERAEAGQPEPARPKDTGLGKTRKDTSPDQATPDQFREMNTLFEQLGFTDKAAKSEYVEHALGHPVAAAKDMTAIQAESVINSLRLLTDMGATTDD